MAIGESRTELLQWLNSTFELNYTKLEQCGTGAAYCQILDSIYGGVPLARVKFDLHLSDYDARANMKVLQSVLNKHKITKQVETEKLMKCRLSDNLELLQWLKKLWMENKDINVPYDAVSRRKGGSSGESSSRTSSRRSTLSSASTPHPPPNAPAARGLSRRSSSGSLNAAGSIHVQKRRVTSSSLPSGSEHRMGPARASPNSDLSRSLAEATEGLEKTRDELKDYQIMAESLRTERNVYFNKLREIEILITNLEMSREGNSSVSAELKDLSLDDVVGHVKEILYAAEEGFEVQEESHHVMGADNESF